MNKPLPVPPLQGNPDLIALLERKLAEAKSGKLIGLALITVAQMGADDQLGVNVETRGGPEFMLSGCIPQLTEQLRKIMFPTPLPGPAFETRRLSS